MRRDNKGYSLLEIIIVLAILAVVTGLVTLSLSAVLGWRAKECANRINGYLSTTKTEALSKDNCEMDLYFDADYKVKTYKSLDVISGNDRLPGTLEELETVIVGDDDLHIEVILSNSETIDIALYKITIGFDRASGAFHPVKLDGSSTYATDMTTGELLYAKTIKITQGSKIVRVYCIPLTGKHYVE